MPYEVLVDDDAFRELQRHGVPESLYDQIADALLELAQDPVALGEKPLIPYPERGQAYFFQRRAEGLLYSLVAFFFYLPDESAIYVTRVRHARHIM